MDKKYASSNLFPKGCKYDDQYQKDDEKRKSQLEESIAERIKLTLKLKLKLKLKLFDMPSLEGDE